MKNLMDVPPVWLGVFAAAAWVQGQYLSLGLAWPQPFASLLGGGLIGLGLILIGLAAFELWRHRTTIMPHVDPCAIAPAALVQSGIFARSRNPIYLADAFILSGLVLRWDAVLCVILVPVFMWWIARHFIEAEEIRLQNHFADDFPGYARKVRRWL